MLCNGPCVAVEIHRWMKKSISGLSHALSSLETLADVSFLLIFHGLGACLWPAVVRGLLGVSLTRWATVRVHPGHPGFGAWVEKARCREHPQHIHGCYGFRISVAEGAVESRGEWSCRFTET